MNRTPLALLAILVAGCGGDTTPLPPLAAGPQWMPIVFDTTGNMMMRRMAIWIDTAHVTTSAAGYAVTAQKMQMDMKLGGMSTGMQMRTEFDCSAKRYRVIGMDSMSASVKGVAVPDSVARQAVAQQSATFGDTNWLDVTGAAGTGGAMLAAVCAKVAVPAPER